MTGVVYDMGHDFDVNGGYRRHTPSRNELIHIDHIVDTYILALTDSHYCTVLTEQLDYKL